MHYIYFFFFFIAQQITTLKILQIFPSLTKWEKSQRWGELIFTCLATKFRVLYILWTEPEWHQFLHTYIAIIKSRNFIMLYGLLLLLSCSGDWTWSWCNPMTAFVSNYIVMKDNDLNYFPCFEEKNIFLYTVVFFFFWKKKFNCTFYLTNSCIFHRGNIVVKIVTCIFVIHFPLFSVNRIHLYVDFIL